jgi:hypothetical protein
MLIYKEIKIKTIKKTPKRRENKRELGLTCIGWTRNWSICPQQSRQLSHLGFSSRRERRRKEESPAMCFYPTGGKGNTA